MIAVFVNCIAVIVGSVVGILVARKVTDSYADAVQTAAGIISMVLGFQMAFQYQNVVFLALSLIIGGMLGTFWDVDGKILALGSLIEKLVFGKRGTPAGENASASESASAGGNASASAGAALANESSASGNSLGKNNKNFAYAFLNASVLFCVGAMSIIGSFRAAIEHDYTIIFTKSVLDGFMAITFAAAMGIGTAFSAVSILVYQGALTLLSGAISPFVTEQMISELTGVGGATIIMIGINLSRLRTIKTANFLPSLIIIILLVLLDPFIANVLPF